jgi:hypothetical protein
MYLKIESQMLGKKVMIENVFVQILLEASVNSADLPIFRQTRITVM